MAPSRTSVPHVSLVDLALRVALAGFLLLAAYASYEGLFDIIVAEYRQYAASQQRFYILAAVCLITVTMLALLEVALRRGDKKRRFVAAAFYVVLALWSIGFSYGFWWKVIASRIETQAGVQASATNVNRQVDIAAAAIHKVDGLLVDVIGASEAGKQKEISEGGSCGIASKPGDGPLAKRRKAVTDEVEALKKSLQSDWVEPLRGIVEGSQGAVASGTRSLREAQDSLDPKKMQGLSDEKRAEVYEWVRRSSETAISRIDLLNDTQGAIFAGRFNALADRLEVPAAAGSKQCHDTALAAALRAAALSASDSPKLTTPNFEINEGAAATVKAFNKIWNNVFWASYSFARALGADVSPGRPEPFSRFDTIALIASIVVDICIFVLAFVRVRKPFDAGHRFQQSTRTEREKLAMTLKTFASDVNLDARRVFNSSILRFGKEHFFILPHLSGPIDPSWRPSAGFLQNILVVLESMGAIDKSYEPVGIRAHLRSLVPGMSMRLQFERASQQMTRFGWTTKAETDQAASTPLSLHRFRNDDLLELLLVARAKDMPAAGTVADLDTNSPDVTAPPESRRKGTRTFEMLGPTLGRIFTRTRSASSSTQGSDRTEVGPVAAREMNAPHGDNSAPEPPPAIANQANSDLEATNPAVTMPRLETYSEFLRNEGNDQDHSASLSNQPKSPIAQPANDATFAEFTDKNRAGVELPEATLARQVSPASLEGVFSAIDDMSRGIIAARGNAEFEAHAKGLEMTREHLTEMLCNEGLEPVARVGDRFDRHAHEVLLAQDGDDEEGRILSVERQGYRDTVTNRLVRRAGVIVASGRGIPSDRTARGGRSETRHFEQNGRA